MPRSFQELIFGYENNQNNNSSKNNQKGGKKVKRKSSKSMRKAKGKLSTRKRFSLSVKNQRRNKSPKRQSRKSRRNSYVNHERYGRKSNNQFMREFISIN